MSERSDPVERIIADALDRAGVVFVDEHHPHNAANLDFYLPELGLYIEAKRMASDRSGEQLKRADEVILIQGKHAAEVFATWVGGQAPT